MKKVMLYFYSKNNLGDDLFVKIVTDRYTDTFTSIVLTKNLTFSHIKNLRIFSNKVIFIALKVIEKISGSRNLLLQHLAKSNDLLLYVGGSIFMEGDNPNRWYKERDFYRKLKVPYFILGSNFGPYQTNEFVSVVTEIIQKAKDVCFRDQASYETFKESTHARVATDIAFSLDIPDTLSSKQDKLAVISVIDAYRKFDIATAQKYESELINITTRLIEQGYKVKMISFCKHEGDEDAICRIQNQIDSDSLQHVSTYMYNGALDEALNILMESEIVVASRFHAVILGLLYHKKVLPMAYSDKTLDILQDIDFKGTVIDIRSIEEFNGSHFDINSFQYNDISQQISLAEKQFQELDKVLTRRK